MTYRTIADMVESISLTARITAAAATENLYPPEQWVHAHRWELAASPGWGAAWDSAIAGGVEDPGNDEGVITDGMILAAIQQIVESEKPPVVVTPGSTVNVPSTNAKVVADPQVDWPIEQYATFTDGEFRWVGGSWVAYVSAPPPGPSNELPDPPDIPNPQREERP